MRLTLAVPQLAAMPAAGLAGIASLARLARYAPPPARTPDGIDAAVVATVVAWTPGMAPPAIAPLAAAGAGFDPGHAYVLRADPVALVAGRDDVLLAGRVDDLALPDACALVAALDRHFADDGLHFHAPRADAWFVVVAGDARPETTPLPAVRGALHPHEPRGPHARTWRRWLSEVQMLLHAHPVNAAREARGETLVTGLWISEGGIASGAAAAPDLRVYAAPGRTGDVARGLARSMARAAALPPARFADVPAGTDALIVLPAVGEDTLAALATDWLDPVAVALERGALTAVALIGDAATGACMWNAARPSTFARWSARWSAPPFVVPGH